MAIITRFIDKIKLFLLDYEEEIEVSLIIVFVGISSFFLGKYSVLSDEADEPILFEKNGEADLNDESLKPKEMERLVSKEEGDVGGQKDGQIVASKNGKRYYPISCASASRISEKNKIFFASAIEAEKAGLSLAAGCK